MSQGSREIKSSEERQQVTTVTPSKQKTVAMIEAVKLIKDKSLKKVKIWTDSKAITEALNNFKANRDSNLTELKKLLSEEAEKADIAICWIPGHVGIEGNEKADKEANIAKEMDQKDTKNNINAVNARLKKKIKYSPQWDERKTNIYGNGIERTSKNRREQVLLAQIRTGHCPNTRYYAKRTGKEKEARCSECGEEEEKDHWLECVRWEEVRIAEGIVDIGCLAVEEKAKDYL